jgi:hypothetical protein
MQSRRKYSTKKKGGNRRRTGKNFQRGGFKLGFFRSKNQKIANKGAKRAHKTGQLHPDHYKFLHQHRNKVFNLFSQNQATVEKAVSELKNAGISDEFLKYIREIPENVIQQNSQKSQNSFSHLTPEKLRSALQNFEQELANYEQRQSSDAINTNPLASINTIGVSRNRPSYKNTVNLIRNLRDIQEQIKRDNANITKSKSTDSRLHTDIEADINYLQKLGNTIKNNDIKLLKKRIQDYRVRSFQTNNNTQISLEKYQKLFSKIELSDNQKNKVERLRKDNPEYYEQHKEYLDKLLTSRTLHTNNLAFVNSINFNNKRLPNTASTKKNHQQPSNVANPSKQQNNNTKKAKSGNPRSNLLSAIRAGTKLRNATSVQPNKSSNPRSNLLSAIRAGRELRKVEPAPSSSSEKSQQPQPQPQLTGMAAAMSSRIGQSPTTPNNNPNVNDPEWNN